MYLLKKEFDPDACPVLYDVPFTPESLARDFEIKGGEWEVRDRYLYGRNRGNYPGMAVSKASYCENVMLDFRAKTVLPCTHDINVMWNGSWNEETNTRDVAYVAGLEGWWHGKVGFEKSPEYRLNAATSLLDFTPGHEYHIQCGSIDGHVFIIVDGALALEVTDTDPIDVTKYGKVGFEAYCASIAVTDFKVRRIVWKERLDSYTPEF